MTIEQTFEKTEDGTRIITKDDINVDFKLTEKSKGMYARRLNIYSNHSFLPPKDDGIFKESAPVITLQDAYKQTEDFWDLNRPEEAGKRKQNTVEKLMAKLRSVPIFYVTETILTSGYIGTSTAPAKNKFEIGPANTFISGNAIEGARFRVGGTTTTAFSKRLFLEGYAAYGTTDRKIKYDGLIEYSFNDKKEARSYYKGISIDLLKTVDGEFTRLSELVKQNA